MPLQVPLHVLLEVNAMYSEALFGLAAVMLKAF